VFIDRDGVVTALVADPNSGRHESPFRPADEMLEPGAVGALNELARADYPLIGVSNQPAAAKGLVKLERLEAVQRRVEILLEEADVQFDAFEICPHHPHGVVASLTCSCPCRKPSAGMLLAPTARLGIDLGESWMIGDTDTDIDAGRAAGTRTALVLNAASSHKRRGSPYADLVAADLAEAVELILGRRWRACSTA
jgi:histidinol-phosphate phosphatase family protein